MEQNGKKAGAMKWTVITVASSLLAISTIYRMYFLNQPADEKLCWVFIVVCGLVFGASVFSYLDKIKK